jgi:predicted secreted Zn-dependent protease
MALRRSTFALLLAASLIVGACGGSAPPGPTSAGGSLGGALGSSPPEASPGSRSPAPTPATILAVDLGHRPSGPWAVTFQVIGKPAIREVYVLEPACSAASCDIDATIQTFGGVPIGTGVFTFADGMYRYEADRTDTAECNDGFEDVPDGATRVTHTSLLIAVYRTVGTSANAVDIRGTRTVTLTPRAGNSCKAETLSYVANGEATQFASGPTATPRAPNDPRVPTIGDSFFGAGATVDTYGVTGSTASQIVGSIQANGPWSDWLQARAEAVTRAVPHFRFTLVTTAGHCHIEITARPAVTYTFAITLPRWTRPKGVDSATVLWWSSELTRVATHERHHVDLYRAAATRMTDAVGSSTCSNVSANVSAIAKEVNTQQCEFDLQEYGSALGLSLASCVNQ